MNLPRRIGTLLGWVLAIGFVLAPVPASAGKETAQAKAVLDRAVRAMGGEQTIYQTRTLVIKAESTRVTTSGRLQSPTTTYFRFPLSVRQEITLEGKMIAMASTPDGAFLETDAGVMELPEVARHNLEVPAMRNPISLLKGRRGRMFEAKHVGMERIGDVEADIIEIRVGDNVTLLAVDPAGHMIEQRYDNLGEDGRKGKMVVRFDDFRDTTGGFVYPHRIRAEFDRTFAFESVVADVQRNLDLSPRLFAAGLGSAGVGSRPPPPR